MSNYTDAYTAERDGTLAKRVVPLNPNVDEKGRKVVAAMEDRELLEEIATKLRMFEDTVTELFESAKENPMFRMLLP